MGEGVAGRRSYDRIDPAIEVFIKDEVGATRHLLRGEFTVAAVELTNKMNELADVLEAANLQQVEDHAQVNGKLDRVQRDVTTLMPLAERVAELEGHDRVDDAVAAALKNQGELLERGRVQMRNWAFALASLIVAATGVLVGVIG